MDRTVIVFLKKLTVILDQMAARKQGDATTV